LESERGTLERRPNFVFNSFTWAEEHLFTEAPEQKNMCGVYSFGDGFAPPGSFSGTLPDWETMTLRNRRYSTKIVSSEEGM
jgi:hypothetical protein